MTGIAMCETKRRSKPANLILPILNLFAFAALLVFNFLNSDLFDDGGKITKIFLKANDVT